MIQQLLTKEIEKITAADLQNDEEKLLAKLEANKRRPMKKSGFMKRLEEAQRMQQEQLKRQQDQLKHQREQREQQKSNRHKQS